MHAISSYRGNNIQVSQQISTHKLVIATDGQLQYTAPQLSTQCNNTLATKQAY